MAARASPATSLSRWRMCGTAAVRVRLVCAVLCVMCVLCSGGVRAGLYSESDQVAILSPDNVDAVLFNSPSAALLEFYASWCGHCVAFSPVWKKLALDIKEWKLAVYLAAIDCADESNRAVCVRFGITGYPSLRFLPAFSSNDSTGEDLRGFSRDVAGLRHLIIDKLESHKHPGPPACPPLEKTSAREIDSYVENSRGQNLALVFEEDDSYVGREVILDLLQYENITVRRVLRSEEELMSRLSVTDFPSVYLYKTHTNFTRLPVLKEARAFYSYALQRLPGVVREGKPRPEVSDFIRNETEEQWRPFNKTRVYMSDLESALHYSLRVELASHLVISGEALIALRGYVSVLDKYFPGRPPVKNALKAVNDWLQKQKVTSINYSDFREALDTTSADSYLPKAVRWMGCQGSKQHYRGYPCAMWTLFHTLTVQALETESKDPQEVLQAMRRYVSSFFGCRPCAVHFKNMAQESMDNVNSLRAAVLWLWSRHNRVNARLAGELSEDPHFPKVQWPPPDLCPACHSLKPGGEHTWLQDEVLAFLRNYYSAQHLLHDFLSDDIAPPLTERRKAREAVPVQEQEAGGEVEEEEMVEEVDGAPQDEKSASEALPRKPSIVGLRLRQFREDIVDLDSFIVQHYKAKAPLKRQDTEDEQHVRRTKRDLAAQEVEGLALEMEAEPEPYGHSRSTRWMFVLSVGFSRLDVSLCVTLYLLSTLCIVAMCLYFRVKRRQRRTKVALP
ncbi:sulfhydryl oxidase 1 [Pangasianodon hypophthalmus]|uniref:sulfhydryl oxidase 1 n=1 Tax=Pangasianodon hypophthalmus TaxID=310915 RepID=UPI002307A578|nr:sulfhydryl oxidase 1 [Pangasianodon hypophthalmus]